VHTWELIKAILHSVDFYWKKFFVLLFLIAAGIGGYFLWRSQSIGKADIQFAETPNYSSISQVNLNIDVGSNGQVLINNKNSPGALKIYPEYYEVRILAINNPSSFISSFRATMNLPKDVEKNQVEAIIYGVHGVGSYRAEYLNSRTLVYQADNISTGATLSIVAHLPKDILTPSLYKKIIYNITNVPAPIYFGVAISLPLLAMIIMLAMIFRRRQDQILYLGVSPINKPPDKTCPAVAGVLLDGQVGGREIAATIIDLACRGYIYITRKGENFTFGKRKGLNYMELSKIADLKPFEKILLSKIFEPENYKSTREDVEWRVGHHIFSRKIAQVYLEIYNQATRSGYFIENPSAVHLRWKYTGIALFVIGLLGFAHTAFFAPDPKFTLIFWLGEIAASSVIVRLSGLMPTRSAKGSRMLHWWMAFRSYLKERSPIEPGTNLMDKFVQYLPFAMVFGVEVEWARRFQDEPFTKPDWYDSTEQVTTLDRFVGGLFPLINFVSVILAKSHEPTVE